MKGMMVSLTLLFSLSAIVPCLLAYPDSCAGPKYKIVCYYTNWAQYRPRDAKFFPENVDPTLCTHIIFAFGEIVNQRLELREWNDEQMIPRLMALKEKNGNLKILFAVGGWNAASNGFKDIVASEDAMHAFAKSSIGFLKKYKFDGLDLDWEYPGVPSRGSEPSHKQKFTKLVQILNSHYKNEETPLLLAAAVAAGRSTIEQAYEIAEISEELDFIDLMSYDLHGSWEDKTGIHTALYPRSEETNEERDLNVATAIKIWLDGGCPPEKLVVGLAAYGRSFRLVEGSTEVGVGAPVKGPGWPNTYTREAGFFAYYEICQAVQKREYTAEFDDEQKAMYAYSRKSWVGYDNAAAMSYKLDSIKSKGLGGAMFWALDFDDFTGNFCGEAAGTYPLLRNIHNALSQGAEPVSSDDESEEPKTTDSPATHNPPVTDDQSVTEAPETVTNPYITNSPPVTGPHITNDPVVTDIPFNTDSYPFTDDGIITNPFITDNPVVTDIPVITDNHLVTDNDLITNPPATDEYPATYHPSETRNPVITETPSVGPDVSGEEMARKQCQLGALLEIMGDCAHYMHCTRDGDGVKMRCGSGTQFNPALKTCDWPNNVNRSDCIYAL